MFVKDNYSYTRGVGAVAAMDAVSPTRRKAASKSALAMARRDALMAMSAMRADGTAPKLSVSSGKSVPIETGQESAFSRTPTVPKVLLVPTKPAVAPELVKLPGTTITPPKPGDTTPTQGIVSTAAPPQTTPTPAPTTTIVTGGSGTSWVAPQRKLQPVAMPAMQAVEVPESMASGQGSSNKTLLYIALGIGAWWLLTRK